MSERTKYAIVGAGGRARMFIDAILKTFTSEAELVAFCDTSKVRMNWHNHRIEAELSAPPRPTYAASDFDRMVREHKPDVIIVTSPDYTHHEYIDRAMRLGCDVISEKPMTIDAGKANVILKAMRETGKKLRMTFNYRYMPLATKVRELVASGVIGRPMAVSFNWLLDTRHGADYFRRWHREKDKSGGLLVHKATHHFDLVNWWLASVPKTVFAMGGLKFYGRENAIARGDEKLTRYPRYTGVAAAADDPFALKIDGQTNDGEGRLWISDGLRGLYYEAESETGYIRDRNVFDPDINIEDTMSVMVNYNSGVVLNYSLVAYSPWEGFQIAITGEKGRVEVLEREGSHIIAGQSDSELTAAQREGAGKSIVLHRMFKSPEQVEIPTATGGHGGGDPVMLEQIFSRRPPADPFKRAASYLDGAASIAVGICANESMRTGRAVQCSELISLT